MSIQLEECKDYMSTYWELAKPDVQIADHAIIMRLQSTIHAEKSDVNHCYGVEFLIKNSPKNMSKL